MAGLDVVDVLEGVCGGGGEVADVGGGGVGEGGGVEGVAVDGEGALLLEEGVGVHGLFFDMAYVTVDRSHLISIRTTLTSCR